jgi:hypothetical protein
MNSNPEVQVNYPDGDGPTQEAEPAPSTAIPNVGDGFVINGHLFVVRKKSFKGDLVCRRIGRAR